MNLTKLVNHMNKMPRIARGRPSLMTRDLLTTTRALRQRRFNLKEIFEALNYFEEMPYASYLSFYVAWKNRKRLEFA